MPIYPETRSARDLGAVLVEDDAGRVVAIGRLSLTGDRDGAIDFAACASAGPEPGQYTLRIGKRKRLSAELKTVLRSERGRMVVHLEGSLSA